MVLVARLFAATVMIGTSASTVGADPTHDARLAAFCASCHRLDGQGGRSAPIVGLDPSRFEGLMLAFRADNHPNHIMHAVSLALTDAEVAALASFLATQDRRGERP